MNVICYSSTPASQSYTHQQKKTNCNTTKNCSTPKSCSVPIQHPSIHQHSTPHTTVQCTKMHIISHSSIVHQHAHCHPLPSVHFAQKLMANVSSCMGCMVISVPANPARIAASLSLSASLSTIPLSRTPDLYAALAVSVSCSTPLIG